VCGRGESSDDENGEILNHFLPCCKSDCANQTHIACAGGPHRHRGPAHVCQECGGVDSSDSDDSSESSVGQPRPPITDDNDAVEDESSPSQPPRPWDDSNFEPNPGHFCDVCASAPAAENDARQDCPLVFRTPASKVCLSEVSGPHAGAPACRSFLRAFLFRR
jgi:hypothetical protein